MKIFFEVSLELVEQIEHFLDELFLIDSLAYFKDTLCFKDNDCSKLK